MSATNTSDAGRSERQEEVSTALLHPKEPPPTRRGRRTRAALVDAARYVFEQVGYLDARLSDITARAGCSTGTFYTYFRGKDEVMAAVLQQLEEDMLEASGHRTGWNGVSPVTLIRSNNRAYLEAYQRNAMLMRCLEQVAVIDPEFQRQRMSRAHRFVSRNANLIRQLVLSTWIGPGVTVRVGPGLGQFGRQVCLALWPERRSQCSVYRMRSGVMIVRGSRGGWSRGRPCSA